MTVNVVRVVDRLNLGGAAYHVLFLSGLDRLGYRTHLLKGTVAAGEAEIEDPELVGQVHTVEIQGLGREVSPLQDLSALFGIYRQIRSIRPSVVWRRFKGDTAIFSKVSGAP